MHFFLHIQGLRGAQGKIYHEPNLCRSWGRWMGGFLHLLKSRHNFPPILEESLYPSQFLGEKLLDIRCLPKHTLQIWEVLVLKIQVYWLGNLDMEHLIFRGLKGVEGWVWCRLEVNGFVSWPSLKVLSIWYIIVQDFLPYKLEAMNGLICKLVWFQSGRSEV